MSYYDPEHIRAIPMMEVAKRLGLSIDERGYTFCPAHWGGADQIQATCSLNEEDNYFRCSCGNSGWNTDLVSQTKQCDIVEAVQWLGQVFELTPVQRPKKTDYVARSRGLPEE